jgi:hypothetical protein
MRKLFSYFVIILAIGLLASRASAQDDTEFHRSFGCSSTQAESTFSADLNHPSKVFLVPVTNKKELDLARTAPCQTIYSKIDSAKYTTARVDFYVRHDWPKDPEEGLPYAPFVMYVKLTSREQALWWKVVEGNRENLTEPFLSANLPLNQDDDQKPLSPASILPATGDRTIPIFDVQWQRDERGTSVQALEQHLLLDLSLPQPKVAADLSCASVTAFGACGVYDIGFQDRGNSECDWDPAAHDFRCEATIWSELSKRQTKSWFYLLSDKEIPFAVPAGNPASLQQFAQFAERDPKWREQRVELPGLGKTSDVLRVSLARDRIVHILGSYGDIKPMSFSFFFVLLDKGTAKLGYLPALPLYLDFADTRHHSEHEFQRRVDETQTALLPASQIEVGADLNFSAKELFATGLTHIYQITAHKDRDHAVYWLAIDDQPAGGPTLSMIRIASDAGSYAGCAHYSSDTSAAAITTLKGDNFTVDLDVEPPHTSSEAAVGFIPPNTDNGEKLEDQCPYSLHLEWNHQDWVADDPRLNCGPNFSPREITIADDAAITAKPGAVNNSDSQ